ncbi:MAG: outer membrane protein assembly factor BamE, partial [Pseudomonadota bacterium]
FTIRTPRSVEEDMQIPFARIALAAAFAAALAGCARFEDNTGVIAQDRDIARLTPGETRKEDVAALLGGPSTIGTFDDNRWYYVGSRATRLAFFDPNLQEQRVVVVEFEDDGVLRRVRKLDESDSRSIDRVARETPTAGAELTFVQQLLGNLGRFNENQ